jgi:surfactin synthase thioesterase subunit
VSVVLDTLRADYRVCKNFTYSPNKKLDIPIQVLAGRQDAIAPDKIEAWREETSQSFGLDWFDGGHFFFRQQETQVLKTIERSLRYQLENECRGNAI